MVDLSHAGAQQFWFNYKDPMIYRIITFMESVEHWTVDDNPALEAVINKLGQSLDYMGDIDLQNEADFIQLAAYLKSSRFLRLLQAMDTAHPGAASKLLLYAEESTQSTDDDAGLFLRRNVVFERLRLLARLFSKQRLALITSALEDEA